jgi:hypothetical protein
VKAYEISPVPYIISKIISRGYCCSNLQFIREDFFYVPLGDVSLVVCYLYSGAMTRLKTKFEKELKPDAYVLSHTFAVPGWTPISMIKAEDLYHTPIYLYQLRQSAIYKS